MSGPMRNIAISKLIENECRAAKVHLDSVSDYHLFQAPEETYLDIARVEQACKMLRRLLIKYHNGVRSVPEGK